VLTVFSDFSSRRMVASRKIPFIKRIILLDTTLT
jgi:hypothetical protein